MMPTHPIPGTFQTFETKSRKAPTRNMSPLLLLDLVLGGVGLLALRVCGARHPDPARHHVAAILRARVQPQKLCLQTRDLAVVAARAPPERQKKGKP